MQDYLDESDKLIRRQIDWILRTTIKNSFAKFHRRDMNLIKSIPNICILGIQECKRLLIYILDVSSLLNTGGPKFYARKLTCPNGIRVVNRIITQSLSMDLK